MSKPSTKPSTTPTITTVGTSSTWVPADHADLAFTVRRRAGSSADASAAASDAYGVLDTFLTAHGDVVVRRHVSAITVRALQHHDPNTGQWVQDGFEASRIEAVRLAPVASAGAVLRAIVMGVPDVTMAGPWFGVDPDHPAHAEVRAAAAKQAREVAKHYAAGLGLSPKKVVRIGTPGSTGNGHEGNLVEHDMMFAAKSGGRGGDDGAPLADLTDEDVEVSAAVEVVMTLE